MGGKMTKKGRENNDLIQRKDRAATGGIRRTNEGRRRGGGEKRNAADRKVYQTKESKK